MSIVVLETAGAFEWEPLYYFDTMEEAIQWVEENYGISYSEYQEECPECDFYEWQGENEIKLTEVNKYIK